MDFDRNLMKVQGVLISFSNNPTGNWDATSTAIANIVEKGTDEDKSKIVFFLYLNTETNVSEVLREDENVGFLVGTCPSLQLSQFTDLIVELKLLGYLHDIIRHCPGAMTVPVLERVRERIGASGTCPSEMGGLLTAILEKVIGVKMERQDDVYFDELVSEYRSFLKLATNGGRTESGASNDELLTLSSALDSIRRGAQLVKGNAPIRRDSKFAVDCARINAASGKERTSFSASVEEFDGEKFIRDSLTFLLERMPRAAEDDCDRFAFNGMAESAYALGEEIFGTGMEPRNCEYLRSIGRKPVTITDEVSRSDMGTVISKVKSGEPKDWFDALIASPNAYSSEEATVCIHNFLDLAEANDLKTIVCGIETNADGGEAGTESVLRLYLSALRRLPLDDQLHHFKNYYECNRTFCSEPPGYEEESTLRFNQYSNSDVSVADTKSDLIAFCLQSPLKTITKICRQSLTNAAQMSAWMEHLFLLRAACVSGKHSIPDVASDANRFGCVVHRLFEDEDISDREMQHFPSLIAGSVKHGILDAGFVENWIGCIVMKKGTSPADAGKVLSALEILRSCIKLKSFHCNKMALLAFMSQMLCHTSWDFANFTPEEVNIREIVISIVSSVVKSIHLDNGPDICWLRREISKIHDHNRFYFCDLWRCRDFDSNSSEELHVRLLILLHTKSRASDVVDCIISKLDAMEVPEVRTAFTVALIKILPLLTADEWTSLFTHMHSVMAGWSNRRRRRMTEANPRLEVFRAFATALHSLGRCANKNDKMIPCFKYCVRNFGKVVRQNFLSKGDREPADACLDLAKGFMFVLNGIERIPCRKSVSLILYPVISDVAEHAGERDPGNDSEAIAVGDLVSWFKRDFVWSGLEEENV